MFILDVDIVHQSVNIKSHNILKRTFTIVLDLIKYIILYAQQDTPEPERYR